MPDVSDKKVTMSGLAKDTAEQLCREYAACSIRFGLQTLELMATTAILRAIEEQTLRCAAKAEEVAKRFDGAGKKTHRDKAAGARAAARAILGEGG